MSAGKYWRQLIGCCAAPALLAAVPLPVSAQEPETARAICFDKDGGKDPNHRIRMCNALIGSRALPRPERAQAHLRRADAYVRLNRNAEALIDYDVAIVLDPQMADAFVGRANVRHRMGYAQSTVRADYDEAIRIDPGNVAAHNNRALFGGGAAEDKRADLDTAIRLAPDNAVHFNNRGFQQALRGDHEAAVSDFSRAIELDPTDAAYYAQRGESLGEMGANERALDDFTRAIALAPQVPANHYRRGLSHERLGKDQEALEDYREALRLHPDYSQAHERLCVLAARIGQPSEFDRAFCDFPEHR